VRAALFLGLSYYVAAFSFIFPFVLTSLLPSPCLAVTYRSSSIAGRRAMPRCAGLWLTSRTMVTCSRISIRGCRHAALLRTCCPSAHARSPRGAAILLQHRYSLSVAVRRIALRRRSPHRLRAAGAASADVSPAVCCINGALLSPRQHFSAIPETLPAAARRCLGANRCWATASPSLYTSIRWAFGFGMLERAWLRRAGAVLRLLKGVAAVCCFALLTPCAGRSRVRLWATFRLLQNASLYFVRWRKPRCNEQQEGCGSSGATPERGGAPVLSCWRHSHSPACGMLWALLLPSVPRLALCLLPSWRAVATPGGVVPFLFLLISSRPRLRGVHTCLQLSLLFSTIYRQPYCWSDFRAPQRAEAS
jgi:hypothetical protein